MRLVDPAPAPPRAFEAPAPQRTIVAPKLDAVAAAGPRLVVGWLVGISGSTRGESYVVRMGRNTIGRAPKSDVIVTDDQASGHHADLVYRPEEKRFILMDHNSTNGTFVNEEEISPRRDLQSRDVIRIGRQRFMFVPLCGESFSWDEGEPSR